MIHSICEDPLAHRVRGAAADRRLVLGGRIARQLPGFRMPKVTRPLIDPATPAAARKTQVWDSNP